MKKSLGFTLAEVLITLAIIGVVAAMTIPSVIVNTNQAEFRTGLRKAISVLNSSLTMNIALEGETPFDNDNLYKYLQQHMSVMQATNKLSWSAAENAAFYTTDGMRFEIPTLSTKDAANYRVTFGDHSSNTTITFNTSVSSTDSNVKSIGTCGTKGVSNTSTSQSTASPCLIMVDVNGDKKPNPGTLNASNQALISFPGPNDALLKDCFSVMITDEKAIPFGVVAQKAMYQSQK